MKSFSSIIAAVAVACSFGLSAAHVTQASHANASTTPPKLATGVTLKVQDYFCSSLTGCAPRDALKTVTDAWAAKTHNSVDLVGHPANEVNKFLVSAPSGTGPDIIGVPHDNISTFLSGKVVAPVPAWAFPPALQKQYLPNAIKAITLDGRPLGLPYGIYSMPYAVETTGIFYNKAILSASKFKPLKGNKYFTWGQLIKLAQAVDKTGKIGYQQKLDDLYFEYGIISGNGGYAFKYGKKGYDYKSIGLDSKGAIKGIQFIKDLTDKGKYKLMASTITLDVAKANFQAGKLAMFLDGPWDIADFDKSNVNWGYVPYPSFDGKHATHPFSGFQTFAVNAFTSHKNEAFSLLSYMSQHMQAAEFKAQFRPPVLKSLLKSKALLDNANLRALAAAAQAASPMPPIPELAQLWSPMATAFDNVIKGSATPSEAAKAAVQQIKSNIAKAHGG